MQHIQYVAGRGKKVHIYLLGIAVLSGLITGSVYQAVKAPYPSALIHQFFAPVYNSMKISDYVWDSFMQSVILLAVMFLLGFFALGQPFGVLLLFYKGFGIGASSAMIYELFGIKGAVSIVFLVVPKASAIILMTMLGARELIRSSNYTLSCWTSHTEPNVNDNIFRLYCIKFLVLMLSAAVISGIDSAVNLVYVKIG